MSPQRERRLTRTITLGLTGVIALLVLSNGIFGSGLADPAGPELDTYYTQGE